MSFKNPIPNIDDIFDSDNDTEQNYYPKKEVYFAFIDVLGFKKDFEDLKISKNEGSIEKYRDVFNYYFELMNSASFMKSSGCYAGQTSDSLYFYTERIDYLNQFIKIFMHFNLYAMSKNVFFRGGIAKGSLYTKKMYQYYGDSVIGAYLLESQISKYPIIVLDGDTYKALNKTNELKSFIKKEKNERYYLKPFEALINDVKLDVDDTFEIQSIDEQSIKDNMINNKQRFEYDDSNYNKYVFLINEYKNTIKTKNKKDTGSV